MQYPFKASKLEIKASLDDDGENDDEAWQAKRQRRCADNGRFLILRALPHTLCKAAESFQISTHHLVIPLARSYAIIIMNPKSIEVLFA